VAPVHAWEDTDAVRLSLPDKRPKTPQPDIEDDTAFFNTLELRQKQRYLKEDDEEKEIEEDDQFDEFF